jgi:hypothetical protein
MDDGAGASFILGFLTLGGAFIKPNWTGFSMPDEETWVPALVYDLSEKVPLGPAFFTLPDKVTRYFSRHKGRVPTRVVELGVSIAIMQYVKESFSLISRHMSLRFGNKELLRYEMAARATPVFVDPEHFILSETSRTGEVLGSFALFLRFYHADVVKEERFSWFEVSKMASEGIIEASSEVSGEHLRRFNDAETKEVGRVGNTRRARVGSGELQIR